MAILAGDTWADVFTTAAAATVGPTGALYVNGVADAAGVTITGANPYKFSVVIPETVSLEDRLSMVIAATVDGTARVGVVAQEYVSDLTTLFELWQYTGYASGNEAGPGVALEDMHQSLPPLFEMIDGDGSPENPYQFTAEALANAPVVSAADIADAVWDKTLADHDAAGSTGAALASAAAGGSVAGAGSETVVIATTVDGTAVEGVAVWVTSDEAGTTVVAGTLYSDTSGNVTVYLDPGDYYVWRQGGGNHTNPQEITVADA